MRQSSNGFVYIAIDCTFPPKVLLFEAGSGPLNAVTPTEGYSPARSGQTVVVSGKVLQAVSRRQSNPGELGRLDEVNGMPNPKFELPCMPIQAQGRSYGGRFGPYRPVPASAPNKQAFLACSGKAWYQAGGALGPGRPGGARPMPWKEKGISRKSD